MIEMLDRMIDRFYDKYGSHPEEIICGPDTFRKLELSAGLSPRDLTKGDIPATFYGIPIKIDWCMNEEIIALPVPNMHTSSPYYSSFDSDTLTRLLDGEGPAPLPYSVRITRDPEGDPFNSLSYGAFWEYSTANFTARGDNCNEDISEVSEEEYTELLKSYKG